MIHRHFIVLQVLGQDVFVGQDSIGSFKLHGTALGDYAPMFAKEYMALVLPVGGPLTRYACQCNLTHLMMKALHLTSWLVAGVPTAFSSLLHSAKECPSGIHSMKMTRELPWVIQPQRVQIKIDDLWLHACSAQWVEIQRLA